MCSEIYGVSTMKAVSLPLLVLFGLFCLLLIGCTSDEPEVVQVADSTTVVEEEPAASLVRMVEIPDDAGERTEDWIAIHAMVDEVLTRLSYGDKAGLYENEFRYLREQETFDDYLKHGEVTWANTDSILYVEITDILFFDHDSAMVEALFHMIAGGEGKASPMSLLAFFTKVDGSNRICPRATASTTMTN